MSTWVECEDGTWVNLARVAAVVVHQLGPYYQVRLIFDDENGAFAAHSRHDSRDGAEATAGRFLAASGMRCLRRGI